MRPSTMIPSRTIGGILIFCTLFAGLGLASVFGEGTESKLFGAAYGSVALCLVLPLWVTFRGPVPLWGALAMAVLVVCGMIYLNCLACRMAGTIYVHPVDHLGMLFFCVPGIIYVILFRAFDVD